MIPQELVAAKRDGRELEPGQLGGFLRAYMDDDVGDEQMAAFLMAVYFQGLSPTELDVLVEVMLHSGEVLSRGGPATGAEASSGGASSGRQVSPAAQASGGPRVDKHSTGGVGDKVSLALAPLAAEMGMVVPMMSGRGLGHTGGTLDKLEAIPGFRTRMSLAEFDRTLAAVGCAMIGQTDEIAPMDRRLYALRDVTATVPSLPLITASIMSKKLAESLDGLVLDVKVGKGAFLPEVGQARELARAMVRAGEARGLATTAVLSAMDQPLGRAIGHSLEVREAVACLAGVGPPDLRELVVRLAAEMAVAGGVADALEEGGAMAEAALDGGGAMERFARMVTAQGGDASFLQDPASGGRGLPTAPRTTLATAPEDGVVAEIDPLPLGYGLIAMGGGRTRQDQRIDHGVGFELAVRVGDRVTAGQPLATVHAADEAGLAAGVRAVGDAVRLAGGPGSGQGVPSDQAVGLSPLPLVLERVAGS